MKTLKPDIRVSGFRFDLKIISEKLPCSLDFHYVNI